MSKQLRTNLAYLRFINGKLSQKDVSEATGIGQKIISALERGASKGIEFNTVVKLCAFFNCSPGDLLILEDEFDDLPVSDKSRKKARELVARGLKAAMEAPAVDPEKLWCEYDRVLNRIDKSIDPAESSGAVL
ncbi:helix-turn-helix domain-containing protein [bacterium]|nr:helix-turn-helix domain-containing protein [bacterium]